MGVHLKCGRNQLLRRRARGRLTTLLVLVAALLSLPAIASAHPLGNFTVNQLIGLDIAPGALQIDYVVDMAEIPALQERETVDLDGDGKVSSAESNAYASGSCRRLAGGLVATVDGSAVSFRESSSSVSFPPGEAGLDTLRLECRYDAELPSTGSLRVENTNYADRLGWLEMTLAATGIEVDSDLPTSSPSARLTVYPADAAPLDVVEGEVLLGVSGAMGDAPSPEPSPSPTLLPTAALGELITRTGAGVALALGAAALLGGAHALAPGHGKSILAAYLVGRRATVRQAAGLGLSVAASHTVGVLVLGGITLLAASALPPERLYPWLTVLSGVVVVAVGVGLLWKAFRRRRHDHSHEHDHQHDHDDGYSHHAAPVSGWRGFAALGLSNGLSPSASAVVLLLGAIHLGRVGFGLALIAAYGIGVAVAMAAIALGVATVARFGLRLVPSTTWRTRLSTALPAAMGGLVILLGGVMLVGAGRAILGG